MRKNKLIAFVTALSMMASVGISMVSASANGDVNNNETITTQAVTKGYELEYDADASTSTTRVINIYYRGVTDILSSTVRFIFPAGTATAASFTSSIATQPTIVDDFLADGRYNVVFGGTKGETSPNSQLGTLTLTVPEGTGEFTVELGEYDIFNGNFQEETGLEPCEITVPEYEGGATAAPTEEATVAPTEEATVAPTEEATVAPTAEPVATPYVTTRPTAIPIGTEEPVATDVPTEEPSATPVPVPDPVTKGYELEYDADASTSTTRVINIYYRGVTDILSSTVRFIFPAGTATAASFTSSIATQPTIVDDFLADGRYNVVFGGTRGETSPNNQLGTLTLTVPEGTGEFRVELGEYDIFNGNFQEETDLDKNWVLIPAYVGATETEEPTTSEAPSATATAEPEFEGDDEVNFSDILVDVPDTMDGGSLIAAVVDVTNGSSAAEYGEDFVAEYNGEQLTEDEYFNLINGYNRNGYGDGDMKDVIDNLTILIKDGVTVTASPAYQTTEQAAENLMTVYPAYEGVYPPESTEEPEDGMVTLTVDTPSHGAITVTYTDADGNSVSLDTDDEDIEEEIPAGTSVRLRAIADNGYDFSKWGGDISGTSSPKTITVNRDTDVSATFTRTGSNSSSGGSSSSGSTGNGNSAGGGIARPNTGSNTTVSGINFQDLGSVSWAVDAINYLASAGIINGRSNTEFDPNASVTRAEFAKMVCATFGISATPNAAQTFVDVSPSDWFYGYVQAAAAAGIVNGVSETAFDPNATITREQMAAMLYRAIEATGNLSRLPAGTATVFADEAQIADYAKTYVSALNAAGVINGTSATTFEPKATATRAQAAAIIYQFLKAVGTV